MGALMAGLYAAEDPMAYYQEVLPYLDSASAISNFYSIPMKLSRER